jgi:hypothetical protein
MSDAYIIQTAGETAGIVVRTPEGFQFFASMPTLTMLEGRQFAGLTELHRAIARIEEANGTGRAVRPRRSWTRSSVEAINGRAA